MKHLECERDVAKKAYKTELQSLKESVLGKKSKVAYFFVLAN